MPTTTEVEATLNINAIGARTDFAGTAVADLSAEEIRYDQRVFQEGVLEPTAGFQVVAGAGGTMDVVIGSGSAKVDYAYVSGDIVGQGNYLVRLDDVTKTITLSAPDASQQRIDEIWLVVLDDVYDSSTKALPIFAVREGDVGGSAPGPDSAWEAAFKLATVTLPGGSTDITEATITDERVDAKMVVPAIEATDGTFNGVDVAEHAHTGAAGQGGDVDAGDLLNLKTAVDAANVDADTVDGSHASAFAAAAHEGAGGTAHADATTSVDGFMTAADKSKLNGIESGATADQTASEILSLIKTVDGSGSGLDADLLDGEHASAFANANHGDHGLATHKGSGDHDSRYYTEAESDGRFVNETGDTMTGTLFIDNDEIQIDRGSRSRSLLIMSGASDNNSTHSWIEFTSDAIGNGALVQGTRGPNSGTHGLKFWGYSGGLITSFEVLPSGEVHVNPDGVVAGSGLWIGEDMTDVGNIETLRADRAVGAGTAEVGWFSSREEFKEDIIDLDTSPRFPGLDVIDDIRLIDFRRISTQEREWGFLIDQMEEVDDNLKYLTTKGDKWGDSPDEHAINALQMLAIKDLRSRVAELEAQIAEA